MASPSTAARAAVANLPAATAMEDRSATATPNDAVELALAGDRDAFARLYRDHRKAVHSVLLAGLRRPEDVEDAMQDVFETALRRIGSLRDRRAFGAWLLTVARNRATDAHRRRRRIVPLEFEPRSDAPPSVEADQALALVRSLPEAYRETLMMRLVEGMTGPEIASVTGLRPLSVRVNLHRGMKMLRKLLEGRT